jgi:hypothetical protein
MLHHITLTQLRTFTSPATQFGADNEPYMVLQVNRNPMDFQQLASFLYEFIYPTPASREDLLMASAYLSNINNGSCEGFSSSHPRLLLISKLSGQRIYNLDPAPDKIDAVQNDIDTDLEYSTARLFILECTGKEKWTVHHVTDRYNPINFHDTPVISALARTRILADTATAYHDENDSLLLSSYVDYLNSHFEAFACTSDTETLKLLALTNKTISNILYRVLQIADENPTKFSL